MATERTSEGLTSTLFDTLDMFLKGEIDAEQAKTVSKIADTLLKSVAVDIEHKKLVLETARTRGEQAVADLNLNIIMAPAAAVPVELPRH